MKTTKFIILFLIPLVSGCVTNREYRNYSVDKSKELADVTFELIEPDGNNVYMTFSLISQKTCKDKIILSRIGHVSDHFWGGNLTDKQRLPANKKISIYYENLSHSGPIKIRCKKVSSYLLENNSSYIFKAKNLNPNTQSCGFKVYQKRKEHPELMEIPPVTSNLPKCK